MVRRILRGAYGFDAKAWKCLLADGWYHLRSRNRSTDSEESQVAEAEQNPETPTAMIGTIAIDAQYRRRGIGHALGNAAHTWLEEMGAENVLTHVAEDNAPSLALFRKLGYNETRREGTLGGARRVILLKHMGS